MNIHWVEGIILVIGLMLAAMSAAAETALTALTPATMHTLQERGGTGTVIAYLKHDPNRFLYTVLIVSSTSLIVTSSMATLLLMDLLRPPWSELAATAGLSVVVLILAELTPKNIAVRQSTRVSVLLARPVRFFSIILAPVIIAAGAAVSVLLRLLGQGGGDSSVVPQVTEDDVRSTITLAEQSEGLTEEETERIEGILDLDRVVVDQVMRPRVDIVRVPVDMPIMDALDVVIREGHSRIPVYEDTIDTIVGILYDKDLLKYVRRNQTDVSLRDIVRPAIFVPESKRCADLLREFQKQQVHIAIVFDEFGGTAGLVTLEDILEEIVGEIQDEYDEEDAPYIKESDEVYIFDAGLRLDEVNDVMSLDLATDNGVETLGGFLFERLGEVAEVGDTVQESHVKLEIVEIDGRRIKKVRITREEPAPAELAEEVE